MPSAIDITKPIYGNPTTQSVRDNFSAASNEINALQTEVTNRVHKDGDTMEGFLSLYQDPTLAMHATNRAWVLNQIHSTATAIVYVGDYNAATNVVLTSGQPSIIVGQPLPAATSGNADMYFTVKVGNATSIGNQPPGGVPTGSWLISNGTSWNVYIPATGIITAQNVTVTPAIAGLPGANVYDALGSAFPKSGGTFTGGISFGANIGANTGDASKHITLYDGFAGFSITPNRMNAFAGAALGSGAAFFVTINGLDRLAVAEDLVSITAPLVLPADPILALHAATKQYVDAKPGGAIVSDTAPVGAVANSLWWCSADGQLYVRYNDGTSTQWVPATNLAGMTDTASKADVVAANNNVGRNLLHNSMFNVRQRGLGPFTATGAKSADRWGQWLGTGDVMSTIINATDDSIRAQIGDEAATFVSYSTFTGGSAASSLVLFQQNMEGVRRFAGKTVTVSFWAATNSGSLKVGVSIDQTFGNGGSPSPSAPGIGQAVTVSAIWKRYSVTINIPSAAGKTLGTNADDITQCNFWLSTGSNYTIASGGVGVQSGGVAFWGMQLEIGSIMTPLEKLDFSDDLRNCQRYYQVLNNLALISNGSTTYGGGIMCLPFYTAMRAVPSVEAWGIGGNATGGLVNSATNIVISCSFVAANPLGSYYTFALSMSADL